MLGVISFFTVGEDIGAPAGRDRVFRVTFQPPIELGDGRELSTGLSVGVQGLEHIPGGIVQVDLVSGHQRTQGEGIILDLGDRLTVGTAPHRAIFRSMPTIWISGRPSTFIHSGKTFMMEDLEVVTPMN